MIEVEKERSMVKFEWDKAEHEIRMEALHWKLKLKKKNFV